MNDIAKIAERYFAPLSGTVCRCHGAHHYCLECFVCRADFPDVVPLLPDNPQPSSIARFIDHTCLKPDAATEDICQLCDEAIAHNFFAVCVNPVHVACSSGRLTGSDVKVCSVTAFPLGANTTSVKLFETADAIKEGAGEIDTVINIALLKERKIAALTQELSRLALLCRSSQVPLKCIIETALLSTEEKIIAALAVKKSGADFVKTSTGFAGGGAVAEDVALLRFVCGTKIGIKASGGISTFAAAVQMLKAGANRIGTSKGVQIGQHDKPH